MLLDKLQGVLPFVLLLLTRFLYMHAFGLLYFCGGTIVLLQSDRRLRAQISLRSAVSTVRSLMVAATMLLYLYASHCLLDIIGGAHLWRRLALLPVLDSELTGMATWDASSGSIMHGSNSTTAAAAGAYTAGDAAGKFEQREAGGTADADAAFQGQCTAVCTYSISI